MGMGPLLFDALPNKTCALVAEQLSQLKLSATRWLSAAATPRTPLEEAAAAIFSYHTRSMSFDASQSGAEFWVQSHLESKSIGVPLHRDFDLGALEAEGRTDLFPAVSTITYLSSNPSMPTILLTNFTQGKTVRDSVAREAWVVFPRAGKHLAFAGSAWHGVAAPLVWSAGVTTAGVTTPTQLARPRQLRVTLLVNIWLDHVPVGAAQRERERTSQRQMASAAADDLIFIPTLHLVESTDPKDHERWVLTTARGWTREVGRPSEADVFVGPAKAAAVQREAALALVMDRAECTGALLWIPELMAMARGSAVARKVTFAEGGRRLESVSGLCMSLEPTAHAVAPSEEAIQAALLQAEADYAEALSTRSTDMGASMALIQRAAAGGHAEAQSVMGLAYAQGHGGVAADLEKAVHYCRAAALQDHAEAAYNLVALCNARPGCLDATSSAQAIGWLRQAATQGHAAAAYEAAQLLLLHAPGEPQSALELFLTGARAGHARAQYNAASLLREMGSLDEAIVWFGRAAEQNDDAKVAADAQTALEVLNRMRDRMQGDVAFGTASRTV